MTVHISTSEDGVVVCSGSLDVTAAGQLHRALDALTGDVLLDVSGLDFVDSSGLGAIVATDNRLRHGGGSLVLLRPGQRLRRLLELTGLMTLLTVRDVPAV